MRETERQRERQIERYVEKGSVKRVMEKTRCLTIESAMPMKITTSMKEN